MKKIKLLICFLLIICKCVFCPSCNKQEEDTSIVWSFDDATLQGFTFDNDGDDCVYLVKYTGNESKIIIPDYIQTNSKKYTVTGIGKGAFRENTNITEVYISKNVNRIERSAFFHCTNLRKVNMSDSVTHLESFAFSDCKELREIHFSKNLKIIDEDCFGDCDSLSEIQLPAGLTTINNGFGNCDSIENIIIPDSVTVLYGAFINCKNLKSIIIPDSVEDINYAFYGCKNLETVEIGSKVTGMQCAFSQCIKLNSIKFRGTMDEWYGIAYTYENRECLEGVPANIIECSDGSIRRGNYY